MNDQVSEMADSALSAEWVVDGPGLLRLREPWNALAQQVESPSVFLRHEWFSAAWQWRKHDSQLRLLCVYRGYDLLGICPLIECRDRKYGITLRVLEFLTVPDTQYCDILVRGADRRAVIDLIIATLDRDRGNWDQLRLSYLEKHSPVIIEMQAALNSCRFPTQLSEGHVNPFINLEGGWKPFYGNRSRRLKKANNYVANRIQRAIQAAEILWVSSSSAELDVDRWLSAAVDISRRSWKRQTGKSLDQSGPGDFIRSLTSEARRNGWLSIWLLLFDGKPVAMEYQLLYHGYVHALRADYDEDVHDLSPGSYLNWKLLEQLFEGGYQRYWMGPGENRYKFHWTDHRETLFDLTTYSGTLRGRLFGVLNLRLKPILRRWFKGADPKAADVPPQGTQAFLENR